MTKPSLFRIALLALVCLLSPPAKAGDSRIAVLEIHGAGAADKRGLLTDSIRARIAERLPNVTVITRENVLELLKTNGLTLSDCEGECAVETGKRLGADYVVSGTLVSLQDSLVLSLSLHSTATSKLIFGVQPRAKNIEELLDANEEIERLISRLQDSFGGTTAMPAIPQPSVARREFDLAPDADADAFVEYDHAINLFDDALKAEQTKPLPPPKEILSKWALLENQAHNNPYLGTAKQRVERWQKYIQDTDDALAQVSRDRTKLAKLLPLKSYPIEKKVVLLDEFAGRYGWPETATFVRVLSAEIRTPICDEMLAAQVGPLITISFQDEESSGRPVKVWISKEKALSGNPVTLHVPVCTTSTLKIEVNDGHDSTISIDDPLVNARQVQYVLVRFLLVGPGRYLDKNTSLVWTSQGATDTYHLAKEQCERGVGTRLPSAEELRKTSGRLAALLHLPSGEIGFAWSTDGVMSIMIRSLATGEEKTSSPFDSALHAILCVKSQ